MLEIVCEKPLLVLISVDFNFSAKILFLGIQFWAGMPKLQVCYH